MKFRRHLSDRTERPDLERPGRPGWTQRLKADAGGWTGIRLYAALFAAAAVIGYILAALVLFPVPIFVANATVPRVIGLQADSAHSTLTQAGLKWKDIERLSHPRAPASQVV